ncbi:MAG: serine hydrolase [Ruminococcaceae bacterium]|nr:serine hydrolase [Oscillospiraceae bacterium]
MKVTQALIDLIENERKVDVEVHSITVYRRGEKIISFAVAPYDLSHKKHIYSVSKSFTSTAIGIACDMGYLSLDEKIVDIFPEKCPENISENLAEMTLLNVLSMNTGHENCVMQKMVNSPDPVKAFLDEEVQYKPGTHFAYNTGATFIASACLTKRTSCTVLDFLSKHLFSHMGIECPKWYSYAGISEGGVGIHMSTEDMAKLGFLYLNGGLWQGKRLLSKGYVKKAVSVLSDSALNGSADWCAGYGLQFWRNAREGYRGDGAYGQLLMVFPKRDIVVALIGECGGMQVEVDAVYDFVDAVENATGAIDYDALSQYFKDFYKPFEINPAECELFGKIFDLAENKCGFTQVRFENKENGADIYLSTGSDISKISLCSDKWENGTLKGRYVKPVLEHLTVNYDEPFEFVSSGVIENDKITAVLRGTNCPHKVTYEFALCGEELKIERNGNKNDQHLYSFSGCEI